VPLNGAGMNLAANALIAGLAYAQIHDGDPGASGTDNIASSTRVAINWTSPTDGDFGLDDALEFTGITANGDATHVSFWSAATSGTYYGYEELTGDTTANSAGEFIITDLDADGTAT
jgi:hypothetical protein